MPRKEIVDLIEELKSWLPNYDHGPNELPTLLWRLLASMPGGEQAEDMGYEPFNLGWKEIELLGDTLTAVQDKRDVEDLIQGLLGDEEEVEEQRVREAPGRVVQARADRRSKRDVEIALLSGVAPMGGQLSFHDVATVSRDRRSITLRHAWPEDVDARVWNNLMHLVGREAQRLADETGRSVEVYASGGWTIQQYQPERGRR